MKQLNFNNQKTKLTEDDIDQIINIIGYRCQVKTINRLRSIMTYSPSMIKSFGILDRLIKDSGKWEYVAGQSHTEELKTVRECIMGK